MNVICCAVTEIEECIQAMAKRSLRTLCLAHKDFVSMDALPDDWQDNNPPDGEGLCCDCVVGIIDPLRGDVKEAVRTAQRAGELTPLLCLARDIRSIHFPSDWFSNAYGCCRCVCADGDRR